MEKLAFRMSELNFFMMRKADNKQPLIATYDRGFSNDWSQEARNRRWKGDKAGQSRSPVYKKGLIHTGTSMGTTRTTVGKNSKITPFVKNDQSRAIRKMTSGAWNWAISRVASDPIMLVF